MRKLWQASIDMIPCACVCMVTGIECTSRYCTSDRRIIITLDDDAVLMRGRYVQTPESHKTPKRKNRDRTHTAKNVQSQHNFLSITKCISILNAANAQQPQTGFYVCIEHGVRVLANMFLSSFDRFSV